MTKRNLFSLAFILALLASRSAEAAPKIDYHNQIEPILQSHCVKCHGPKEQQSSLRLDSVALALNGGSGGPAIVPGSSSQSRLIRAMLGADDMTRMPPEDEGKPLGPKEVELLKAWIDQGTPAPDEKSVAAKFAKHWSFQPIAAPAIPKPTKYASIGLRIQADFVGFGIAGAAMG